MGLSRNTKLFASISSKLKTFAPWIALALLLILAWLAYRPGLSGGFLFDDFVNLDALGNYGRIDNWRTFWRFITSGTAEAAQQKEEQGTVQQVQQHVRSQERCWVGRPIIGIDQESQQR